MNIQVSDQSENGTVDVRVIPPLDELFNDYNTHWETDCGEQNLVYEGDFEELAEETGYTEEQIYDAFREYEDESRDAIDLVEQIESDYRTSQGWDY